MKSSVTHSTNILTDARPANSESPNIVNKCWHTIGVWGNGSCSELKGAVHCRNCKVYSQAAIELLDQPLSADYQQGYGNFFSSKKAAETLATRSVIIFRI